MRKFFFLASCASLILSPLSGFCADPEIHHTRPGGEPERLGDQETAATPQEPTYSAPSEKKPRHVLNHNRKVTR